MPLRRLFLILSLLLSVTVTLITANTMSTTWTQLSQSQAGMQAMQQLQAMFIVYEMTSRERGPANGVLGDDIPADPNKQELLRKARKTTDEAFNTLLHLLADDKGSVYETSRQAKQQLQRAREAVDLEANKPRNQRNSAQIRGAVNQMIGVIDTLSPALLKLTNNASASFPGTTDALLSAIQAAALREYAGQLGSQLTATLTTRQVLKTDEFMTLNRLRGRIEQLREQLRARAITLEHQHSVQAALDIMTERYFNSAIPFVEAQIEIGLEDGNYQINTAQFAARYVPDMDSMVSLRDVLLNDALSSARNKLNKSQIVALKTVSGSALLFILLAITWWLLHRRVVMPLAKTTKLIVTIANGNLNVQVPSTKYQDEVADMLGAIAVLRDNSIARQQAEETIRQMAFYDPLTDLPNRRLLEDRLHQILAGAQRHGTIGAVLFIDLDKFKQINDERGHETGDWLLRQVANRMRSVVRDSDTAARIGGDEFIILLPDAGTWQQALLVAEKVRLEMEKPFFMDDGVQLCISSSIGVVTFPDQADNLHDILRFSDEAMYKAKRQGRNAVMTHDTPEALQPETLLH